MRESKIEKHLIKELKKIGITTRKLRWLGVDGAPDRVIFAKGGIYVELKAPGKEPRENQLREHEKMRAAGMKVIVIDSIEQVNYLVKALS